MSKIKTVSDYKEANDFWQSYRLLESQYYEERRKTQKLEKENKALREALGKNIEINFIEPSLDEINKYNVGLVIEAKVMVTEDAFYNIDHRKELYLIIEQLSKELGMKFLKGQDSGLKVALHHDFFDRELKFPHPIPKINP